MEQAKIYKNGIFYCERDTLDNAQWELECLSRSWRKNGGIVIEHTDNKLIVCEGTGEGEQIFTITIIE
jgi:hypothetical protein